VHDVVLVAADENNPDTLGTEIVIAPVKQADHPGPWVPLRATWSPDGSSVIVLLAWNDEPAAGAGLFAVPVDQAKPPVVLVDSRVDA
jgi:hypothetical protein